MKDIISNLRFLRQQIPASVKIVAVSKTMPAEDIMAAYNAGHRIFGENRVNELLSKRESLPAGIEWHFVGHLQTNKVKQLIGQANLIQSVDSLKLLEVIDRESLKAGLVTDCLLQFHIAREETKYGFSREEAIQIFESGKAAHLLNTRICGVMGMATFSDQTDIIREEFRYLKECFQEIRWRYFREDMQFKEISMGMSGDYLTAIQEGATIVRIGTLIFGERKNI